MKVTTRLGQGDVLAGYEMLHLLGSGAMGEVWSARHPRLPRLDAVKVLPVDLADDPTFCERFHREADLAATLWHPNIVRIYDRGEHAGRLWIALELVDGTDVATHVQRHGATGMAARQVLDIVTAVAAALDHAHGRGVIHRDIKPGNILVSRPASPDDGAAPRILLADFGIARPAEDAGGLTTTNVTVGTLAYTAPEQLMGEDVDGRADQYGLAATAYHLLTGTQLFPHSNPAVVIARHLSAAPPSLASSRPELAALDPILRLALSKQPGDRFGSCTEFARALDAAVALDEVTRTGPPWRSAVAACASLVVAAGLLAWVQVTPTDPTLTDVTMPSPDSSAGAPAQYGFCTSGNAPPAPHDSRRGG